MISVQFTSFKIGLFRFTVLSLEAISASDTMQQLPSFASPLFANYPEWYVGDVAEFLLLALEHSPDIVSRTFDDTFMTWLLTLICSVNFFKNSYLVPKLVEVLYSMITVSVTVRIISKLTFCDPQMYSNTEIFNFSFFLRI